MEDRTLDSALGNTDDTVFDHYMTDSSNSDSDQSEGSDDVIDETSASSEREKGESSAEKEQRPPIIKKIDALTEKFQILKNDQIVMADVVRGIIADSNPHVEVMKALQTLSSEHELLKKKYVEESSERRRLYNDVIELKGNIRVYCRCRPLSKNEAESGSSSVVDFDASQENDLHILCSDSSKKQFKFDHVFRPEDGQDAVFAQTAPIVTSVLDGYNVCIFAYGQTGTGKTFTMEGTPENRGVNYRTVEELFRVAKGRSSVMRYDLFVSMLEVYNEKIRDLLVENPNQSTNKLEIKQAAEGTQEVPGLVEACVNGTGEVWKLLRSGSQARSVGSTQANELSSRSHCLLRVTVKGENMVNGQRTRSHLWLVDLAGSERVGRIDVEGERLKESQFINKSLSALGDVISALASKTAHVPYRNSKLTHLLQSSLGGDCKTLMFVQISPASADLGETLCSLNFASRVRGIEHGPARKQTELMELLKYKQMAEKVKHDEKEMRKLQDSLQSLQLRLAAREHICRGLQDKVRDLENQLAEERKTRLKQESRAIAAVSSKPPPAPNQAQRPIPAQKKPPLAPSQQRVPLRRITNFLPPRSPVQPRRISTATDEKENTTRSIAAAAKSKTLLQARRGSFVARPPSTSTSKSTQPKRRASIATFHSQSNSQMTTPLKTSAGQLRNSRIMGRQSFVWDPKRVWRTSRVSSPLPENTTSRFSMTTETPMSSRFMGSPQGQAFSSRLRPPSVISLQRKPVVWSPLKLRTMRNSRRSLVVPSA